jgi:hypothetical protein
MPRPRDFRRSKLRNADDDTDINRCGGWSREKLIGDAKFVAAMQRAMLAVKPAATLPLRRRRARAGS